MDTPFISLLTFEKAIKQNIPQIAGIPVIIDKQTDYFSHELRINEPEECQYSWQHFYGIRLQPINVEIRYNFRLASHEDNENNRWWLVNHWVDRIGARQTSIIAHGENLKDFISSCQKIHWLIKQKLED